MKNKFLMLATLATVLVACSKDAESINDAAPIGKGKNPVEVQQPVTFGAYVNRATTRAGAEGVLTTNGTDAGQVSLEREGFGVFAYYTDDDQYSPIYQPNFMYNTKVSGTNWTYAPVRYWPNEFGADASSAGVDRLSFFAYAPHVDVTPSTGIVTGDNTYGIVGLSRNAATGDPLVKYYASLDPSKQVDFCWGVDKTTGKPILDLTKQGVNEKVEFAFNHALAALNVQIDAAIDQLNPGGTLGGNTKIYVRSVTFEGFVTKGAFNLNTDKVTWYDLAGANYIDGGSVTIFDGRTNGKEGQSESANEAPQGLNPVVVQSQPYSGTPTAGVTPTAVNLFDNATATAPLYVIPSGQPLNVTIVYDVETQNPNLTTKLSDGVTPGTSVENKITKAISFGTSNKLEAGKKYNLTLHLGMTSVKFDATVAEWDESTDNGESSLPDNIGTAPGPGPTPTVGNFRGYNISTGILKRTKNGDNPAVYSLSDEDNQMKLFDYYNHDEYLNVYYFTFNTLKSEIGSDGNNIASTTIVDDWTIPSSDDWNAILFGDATGIKVNNTSVDKGFVLLMTTSGKCGLLVIPDNTEIVCEDLDIDYVADDTASYSDNEISDEDLASLLDSGCVFIPSAGYYFIGSNPDGWQGTQTYGGYYDYGYFWTRTYGNGGGVRLCVGDSELGMDAGVNIDNQYYPVRLVKKVTP